MRLNCELLIDLIQKETLASPSDQEFLVTTLQQEVNEKTLQNYLFQYDISPQNVLDQLESAVTEILLGDFNVSVPTMRKAWAFFHTAVCVHMALEWSHTQNEVKGIFDSVLQ